MISLSSLQSAAFWDRAVCLTCGAAQPDDHDPEDHDCSFCGSPDTVDANATLDLLAKIDFEEENV